MGFLGFVAKTYKGVVLRRFRLSIPKGLKSGRIKWDDDLEKMANEILDLTGQRANLEVIGGITVGDVMELLDKYRDKWKGLAEVK